MSEKEFYGKDVRRLIKLGDSLVISLPQEYIHHHNLKQGARVEIYYNDVVHLAPLDVHGIKLKLGKVAEKEAP
jgi:hypothetical protein